MCFVISLCIFIIILRYCLISLDVSDHGGRGCLLCGYYYGIV